MEQIALCKLAVRRTQGGIGALVGIVDLKQLLHCFLTALGIYGAIVATRQLIVDDRAQIEQTEVAG